MKASDDFVMEQPGDDLFDVLCLIVMPCVHEHICLGTCSFGQEQCHAPISDVRVIEGRLEGFVFDEQSLARMERRMHLLKTLFKITDSLTDVLSPRIIGSVRKPRRDVPATERFRDSDATED